MTAAAVVLIGAGFSYKAMGLSASASISGVSSKSKNSFNVPSQQNSKLNVASGQPKKASPIPAASPTTNSTNQPSTASPNPSTIPTAKKAVTPPPSSSSPAASASDIAPSSACPGESDVSAAQTVLVCMTSYARSSH